MSKNTLKCAVVGLGIGKHDARGYHETEGSELVAIADLDQPRLDEAKAQFPAIETFTDYETMLAKVKPDLVSVALPNFLHAPVTLAALAAGAHVLCEKPMAMTVAEAEQMRDAAKAAGKQLGINLSFRFTPQARALKDLADNGFLGHAYHAHTRWTRRDGFPKFGGWFGQRDKSGGGPLIDLGVHRIDLAMWLMGSPEPVEIHGTTHDHIGIPRAKAEGKQFDVEDFAAGYIKFDNAASLTFEASWGNHQATREDQYTRVIGTEGALVHRNTDGRYTFTAEYHRKVAGHHLSGEVPIPNPECGTAYAEMVKAIHEGRRPLADAEDGLKIQKVLNALYDVQ